jgi:hypothetical protein
VPCFMWLQRLCVGGKVFNHVSRLGGLWEVRSRHESLRPHSEGVHLFMGRVALISGRPLAAGDD